MANEDAAKILHAWYSAKQAESGGTCFYEKPTGGTVEVSMVSMSVESKPNFEDVKYLGVVKKYAGPGRSGAAETLWPPSKQLQRTSTPKSPAR